MYAKQKSMSRKVSTKYVLVKMQAKNELICLFLLLEDSEF